jgi:hypothetical protein
MRGNRFASNIIDCPVCPALAGEQCGVNIQGDIPIHTERARQSRWIQMYAESSASKMMNVFDEAFTEMQ